MASEPPRSADTEPKADSHDAAAPTKPPRRRRWRKRLIMMGVALAVVGCGLYFGRHWIHRQLTTESTDDAYVNSHVTSVSGRVAGHVIAINFDDNDRVRQGDLLLEIDHEPYQVAVSQRRAALDVAEGNLTTAIAQVRAQEAKARSSWYNLIHAQEQVRYQLATIRSYVSNLRLQEAQFKLAETEVARARRLVDKQAASKEELDQRAADLEVARQRVIDATETIRRTRANLGLPPNDADPTAAPADLEETYSAVQTALSDTAQALAQAGVPIRLRGLTPKSLREQVERLDPSGDLNEALDRIVEQAPTVRQARASVDQAREDLRNAELNLRYTYVYAPIDGQVTRRSVNPGDNVAVGQGLMAVRSLTDLWIDANFKETQLDQIQIGHPVEVTVDAYPNKVFHGRVEGFSSGTGQSLALLPPENATGNFVKIVQRLPVRIRIDPADMTPDTPLFVGLSVIPAVKYKEQPSGPDAGKRLLEPGPRREPSRTVVPPLPSAQPTAPTRP
ncbi:HlyD family secretion protein [Frigoriglobus tundricola]|uniref:Membrane fusion component of MSF-type tripartite multidrug efflux system n=1 Tax=Frigoriglobus tundricola TaxID=2774151 RepID=A0A6M5Z284_9BACT|nr:HlyD family secretion protein [Frigoriglobus tundricola]QJX00319.1 Membrane fusion component of MSF-type tripartite multidrug efflux system [Frigoriglobus tundricola]